MEATKSFDAIFKNGSRTYYNSTAFFNAQEKKDVTVFYAFVRVVDDFIDAIPQNTEAYYLFKSEFHSAIKGGESQNQIVAHFLELLERKAISVEYVDAFFASMEMDIEAKKYASIVDVEKYMYGSAEVIGLIMSQILGIDSAAHRFARDLGKAMQYINFIRDISEDVHRGRLYFPEDDMKEFSLKDISYETASRNPENFKKFIHRQINRCRTWQKSAEKGYGYISSKNSVPIKTAADMYTWTANQIEKDPFIVYKKKVKPSRFNIYTTGILNYMRS